MVALHVLMPISTGQPECSVVDLKHGRPLQHVQNRANVITWDMWDNGS